MPITSNREIKKILIGSEEICGMIGQLTQYYRSKGYDVVSIARGNAFYDTTYDYDPARFLESWQKKSDKGRIYKLGFKYLYMFSPQKTKNNLLVWLQKKFIQEFDLYINIWDCFFDEEEAFKAVKKKGGQWITLMVGDDFRSRPVFKNHFRVTTDALKNIERDKKDVMTKLTKMRLHEMYSDAIFSVPDQSSLALRPYFHFQLPIDLKETEFLVPENKILKIVHCPSDTDAKGSVIIEQVVSEIQKEGYEIEFLNLRKIPHLQLMKILSTSDILIDELVFHGPGVLSFEAMASGCVVMTKYFEDSPPCFRPPVISVTEKTLKIKLRDLINDRKKIKEIAIKGRKYVEENNTLEKAAEYYLSKLGEKNNFDYYPDYFKNDFKPGDYGLLEEDVETTNNLVKNSDWYDESTKSNGKV